MKLKKFNEYRSARQLSLNDLSMWLRKGDTITIHMNSEKFHNLNGVKLLVLNLNKDGIQINSNDKWLRFENLNRDGEYGWEITSINNEDVFISESLKENSYNDNLISEFMKTSSYKSTKSTVSIAISNLEEEFILFQKDNPELVEPDEEFSEFEDNPFNEIVQRIIKNVIY